MAIILASCEKDNSVDPIFEGSINERATQLKTEYINILSAPENGWIGYYSPNSEMGTYALLLNFDANGNVQMRSDFNLGANDATITYRIDKTLKMELVFETHSVLHQIYEMEQNSIGGEYVFNIVAASENEVVLSSKTDSGYDGDEITELRLVRAQSSDLNLAPYYTSYTNLIGEGVKSVFRNINVNGAGVASIDINGDKRNAEVSYLEGGELKTVIVPIKLTPNGFEFFTPLTIGGVTFSEFIYQESSDSFLDAANSAEVLYADEPAVPLAPYNFGQGNALYNFIEIEKSSLAFNQFYTQFVSDLETQGIVIDLIYLVDLTQRVSYMYMITNVGEFWFDFTYSLSNGKVYFSLTGATNADAALLNVLQPLLDMLLGSTKGYYIKGTGSMSYYSNQTFSLINADNPAYEINYIDL